MCHYEGSVLNDREIRRLTYSHTPALLQSFVDFEAQLQPAGFDVTVHKITRLSGRSRLSLYDDYAVAAETDMAAHDGMYELPPGSYLFYLNEITTFPLDVAGLVVPRSTLNRCGATLSSALWDPGFRGRGRVAVSVGGVDVLDIAQHAAFAQLVFFTLEPASKGFAHNPVVPL